MPWQFEDEMMQGQPAQSTDQAQPTDSPWQFEDQAQPQAESQPTQDPLTSFKSWMVKEPQPGDRSLFGEPEVLAPVSHAIRAAGDFLIPGSIPEAALQAGVGWAGGKILPFLAESGLRALKAVRPLAKEVAQEALGKLLPEEALSAKAFYQAASRSDKTIPLSAPVTVGKDTIEATIPHNFTQAQEAIQNLRLAADRLERTGQTVAAQTAREHLAGLESQVESVFPGFKSAQKGYAKLKDIGLVQEMVNNNAPLRALEQDIAKGQVMGPEGLLIKGGGRATRWLQPEELKQVKQILTKLGPEPGEHLWQKMAEGRAIGGLVGGALGMQHGGVSGAAEGAALGIAGPKAINWIISQSMRHPVTRAFLKSSLDGGEKGLANPRLWRTLSMLGTRLGLNMEAPDDQLIAP